MADDDDDDENAGEQFFDCKFITFYGETSLQQYGTEVEGYRPGNVCAVVDTFCDVPFRIGFYEINGERLKFSEGLMAEKRRYAKPGVVVDNFCQSFFYNRIYPSLQPLANSWNTRIYGDETILDSAARIIVNAKMIENAAVFESFEKQSCKDNLFEPVKDSVKKVVTLFQAYAFSSNLTLFPPQFKGEFRKYTMGMGGYASNPELKAARDAVKESIHLKDGITITSQGERDAHAGVANAQAIRDIFNA